MTSQYGDPLHPKRHCVSTCTLGTYSYIETKLCVAVCPDTYYSDATTIAGKCQCATFCVDPYFADPA